jgi:glucose/arabinose dehydrogenase
LRSAACLALLLAALLVPSAVGGGARSQLQFQPLATTLSGALFVTVAPGVPNALYVVRQGGRVDVIVNGKIRATPFADLTSLVVSGGEQGLLSIAFHPRYKQNHLVYASYTDKHGDSRITQFRTNGSKLLRNTAKGILFIHQPYANHNGGQILFGPDGRLWAGYGDGGAGGDPSDYAQNPSTKLGKLLALNVNKRGATWQIVGNGLRNPWRFSFDKETADLWIGDVGQSAWEEIDAVPHAQVKPLLNFGWSVYEGKERFKSGEELRGGTYVPPVHVYSHSGGNCSVNGGYVYRGAAVPELRGRYVFGDFCSGTVWSGVLSGGALTDVRKEGRVLELAGFGQDAAGELYAASLSGSVLKLR